MVKFYCLIVGIITLVIASEAVHGKVRECDLRIAESAVNITGNTATGMTINGGIPGPVLRFRERDAAVICVHNEMNVETSIHWHGVLVPPGMDGVRFVSFPPIATRSTFTW
jgi:hypothetical protein